jgi:hypothetical protein
MRVCPGVTESKDGPGSGCTISLRDAFNRGSQYEIEQLGVMRGTPLSKRLRRTGDVRPAIFEA